jgi:RND family efflux transporter MFP subunit
MNQIIPTAEQRLPTPERGSPDASHAGGPSAPSQRPSRSRSGALPYLIGALVAGALSGLFLLGYLPKVRHAKALQEATEQSLTALLRVRVANPRLIAAENSIALPGAVAAMRDTMIFARATGYVHSWKFDLGDSVKAGDLLAEIDQPDIDQELIQARATLDQSRLGIELAKGNLGLCKLKLSRQKTLGPNLTPQEDIDNAQSNYDIATVNLVVASAKVKADEANVHRLEELMSFGRVIAPFDGVITQRFIEIGNLVSGGSGSSAQQLYHLMQIDPILILVDVPQVSAASIAVGQKALVRPNGSRVDPIPGTIAHIANAIDPVTRTMRVQILAQNKENKLLPGMYVQTSIMVPTGKPLLTVSSGALLLSGEGTRIAVVQPDSHITLKTVEIERDDGATLVIASGLSPTDRVVTNPAGRIEEGLLVEIATDQPAALEEKGQDTAKGKEQTGAAGKPATTPDGK